jgi:hypothetical protein
MQDRPGMSYSEAKTRIKRMVSSGHGNDQAKANLAGSIVNQVRVREGDRAARELVREFSR